jgi:hypothetical protein
MPEVPKAKLVVRAGVSGARRNILLSLVLRKFEDGRDFDWNDLAQLVRRTMAVDRDRIIADCAPRFRFLMDLTEEERVLAGDSSQRERELWEKLVRSVAVDD